MTEFCERSIGRGWGAFVVLSALLGLAAGSCAPNERPVAVDTTPRPPIALDPQLPDVPPEVSAAALFEDSGYGKCAPCHAHEYRINGVGPHLVGIYGRPIGSVENYRYSEALKSVGGTWNAATLDRFLADPEGFAPGTKMKFRGIESADTRASIIAYLERAARDEGNRDPE